MLPRLRREVTIHQPTRDPTSIVVEAAKRAAEADKRPAIAAAVAAAKRDAARDAAEEMTRALAQAADASEKATRSAVVQAVNDAREIAQKEGADSISHALLRNKLHRMVVQEVTRSRLESHRVPCAMRREPHESHEPCNPSATRHLSHARFLRLSYSTAGAAARGRGIERDEAGWQARRIGNGQCRCLSTACPTKQQQRLIRCARTSRVVVAGARCTQPR